MQTILIGLRKNNGLTSSAAVEAECELPVYINHIPDMSTENVIAPNKCVENVGFRFIPLSENTTLQFQSRTINGNFTRGYCMQMHRGNVGSHGYKNLEND